MIGRSGSAMSGAVTRHRAAPVLIATTRQGARAARRHVPEQLPVLAVEDCEPRRSGRAHDQHTAAGVQIRQIAARELSGPTHSLREPVPGGHDEGAGLLVDGLVASVAVLDGLRCRGRCGRCLCQDLAGSVQSDLASPEDAVRVLGPSRNANGPAAVRQPLDAQRWQVGRPDLLTRSAVESDEAKWTRSPTMPPDNGACDREDDDNKGHPPATSCR
jgi:hypothetical protein